MKVTRTNKVNRQNINKTTSTAVASRASTPRASDSKPWLDNPKWANNIILSDSKLSAYGIGGVALFWMTFSLGIVYFVLPSAWNNKAIAASLVIMLFPLMGFWILNVALKGLIDWHKFGATPLEMIPFPGIIGGNVGGKILFRKRLDNRYDYHVTLTLVREYTKNSGDDKHPKTDLVWQKEGNAKLRQVLTADAESELLFNFEVPSNLAESDSNPSLSYIWRVVLENKDIRLNRSFEIPVFVVSEQLAKSQNRYTSILDVAETSAELKSRQDRRANVKDFLPFQTEIHRDSPTSFNQQAVIHYPMFRKFFTNVFLIFLGITFIAVGGFTVILIGGFIALVGLYTLGSSLTVTLNDNSLETKSKIFGIPVGRKEANYSDIKEIISKMSYRSLTGNKQILHHNILAILKNGTKIKLAEVENETARIVVLDYFRDKII